jgi:hypothetical protein
MAFTRTPGGLAEKWRFHQVPTIWVEGPTDIFFYEPICESLKCRLEAFHGVENAEALVNGLVDHDYPYLVILDGDYRILKPARSPHRCVIVLARYSFENFLWEKEPVNQACLRHAQCGDKKDLVATELDQVAKHLTSELLRAVVLDVAARRSPSPPAVLPDHIEQLLLHHSRPEIDPAKVVKLVSSVEAHLDPKVVREAQEDVRQFLAARCITHLLKGHLVLGALRRVFLRAASNESGRNCQIPNDALTQLLADIVWRRAKSEDHRALKRKVRSVVRKLIPR